MLGGADNPNGELPSYITGADTCSLYTQSLALKHTYEVYFGYDRTLRKYGRFRQKLPVKTDIRKNSARRRPVTGEAREPARKRNVSVVTGSRYALKPFHKTVVCAVLLE